MRMTKQDSTERTFAVWQPRTTRQLSEDDAQEITQNLTGFFAILAEWSRKESLGRTAEASEPANETDAGAPEA